MAQSQSQEQENAVLTFTPPHDGEIAVNKCRNCRAKKTVNPVCASCRIWLAHVQEARRLGKERRPR